MATVEEAIDILTQLGFPRQQRNERSALALLALLDLTPDRAWSEAEDPLRGITQLMIFMAEHYGKRYAPNTRETVRRQTVHQFLAAGLVVLNPDEPDRPINSGKTVYQVSPASLRLLRAYGTVDWAVELINYQHRIESLTERYALERDLQRIPVTLPEGQEVSLSPGGQNETGSKNRGGLLPHLHAWWSGPVRRRRGREVRDSRRSRASGVGDQSR